MAKFQVWSLDVWGNETDGFDVNDRAKVGTIDLVDDCPDMEVIDALVDAGIAYAARDVRHSPSVEWDDENTAMIYAPRTGKPLFEIDRIA